ncbi:MAG: hypothetical protein EBT45_09015, partial [Alphaproteobacteria bacterium]|nr:hypothetical protein [Alphaproteobacteria bacterium]
MIRKYFLDDTFLRKSFSVCFLFFTLCLLSTLDTVLASDDEDDTENITKGVAALASKKYVLERYDGDLQAQYTDEITLSSGKAFSLIRPGAVAKTQAVTTLTPVPRSHLLAQGICYHSEELYTADIKTSLGFPEILAVPDSVIDWVSYSASAAPVNAGYYSRVTAATVHGGHSEAQFIADMDALWVHDYTAILKLLLPSTVFHGDQDVYMTGIELFGSFDMCSRHTGSGVNRYDCIGKLAEFRENHKTGQKSISKAIRNLLKD